MKQFRMRLSLGAAAVLAGAVLAGCPNNKAEIDALSEQVFGNPPWDKWGQIPGFEGVIEAGFPHGPEARVFINDVFAAAIAAGAPEVPDGAIIVKENDDSGADFFGLADTLDVMFKVDGYSPTNGDWFWANLGKDGAVNDSGRIIVCIVCHGDYRENDFMFLYDTRGGYRKDSAHVETPSLD